MCLLAGTKPRVWTRSKGKKQERCACEGVRENSGREFGDYSGGIGGYRDNHHWDTYFDLFEEIETLLSLQWRPGILFRSICSKEEPFSLLPHRFRCRRTKKRILTVQNIYFQQIYIFFVKKIAISLFCIAWNAIHECYPRCSGVKYSCIANFVFRIFFSFMRINLIQILFALVLNQIFVFFNTKPRDIVAATVFTDTYPSQKIESEEGSLAVLRR